MLAMQRKLSTPFLILLTLPATAMGFALSVQISALSWILSTRYGSTCTTSGWSGPRVRWPASWARC